MKETASASPMQEAGHPKLVLGQPSGVGCGSRETDSREGGAVCRLGDGLTQLLLQLLPNNGASGEMIRQQDRGRHEPAPHSVTGKGRVGGSQLPPRSLG